MSESVIRIPAQQSLINTNNNLIDLIIPGNSGVYDLSNTYVSLLTRVTSNPLDVATAPKLIAGETERGVYDIRVHMKHNTGATASHYNNVATPIECLVQACSMSSATKGGIEDIRRSDILRGTLSVYKEDLDSRQAKALTSWSGACKDTPWVHGQNVQLRGVGPVRSQEVTHEIRFNLRDLFDAGQFEAWDSSVYGDTRIHLELNLRQVTLTQCQSRADITWDLAYQQRILSAPVAGTAAAPNIADFGYKTGNPQKANGDPLTPAVDGSAGVSTSTIIMKTPYNSLADVPFWVGQDVTITPKNVGTTGADVLTVSLPLSAANPQVEQTLAQGASGDPGRAIIDSIQFDQPSGIVTLSFASQVLAAPAQTSGGGTNKGGTLTCDVTGSDVSAVAGEVPAITYEACELVATMRSDMRMGQAPQEHQFSRFVFQGDQFSNESGTQRTYQIPANCTAVVMAITNTGANHSSFLGSANVSQYRFSINGEAVTNRAIPYAGGVIGGSGENPAITDATGRFRNKRGSSLHYDLLQKTFLNMGQNARYQSMLEAVFDQKIPVDQLGSVFAAGTYNEENLLQGWANETSNPQKNAFVLGVPIPMSQSPSQLLLELDGTFNNGASINIYSYVMTSI